MAVTGDKARPAKTKAAAGAAHNKRGGIRFFRILTENWLFKNFILLCIVLNAAMLGYDAHFGPGNPYDAQIAMFDDIFLTIFTVELVLEFLAQGPRRYVRDGWNIFDVIVVSLGYMSVIPGVTALRAFRIFRVLRLVSNVPQMRRVVEALIGALPGIFSTMLVLSLVFYIGAVMGTTFFHKDEAFSNLGVSALTLFQLTLFDDWGNTIARLSATYPLAWVFIVAFTIISAFAVLNLFVGVIVDAVQTTRLAEITEGVEEIEEDVDKIEEDVEVIAEAQEDAAALQKMMFAELKALRAEIAGMRGAGGSLPSG